MFLSFHAYYWKMTKRTLKIWRCESCKIFKVCLAIFPILYGSLQDSSDLFKRVESPFFRSFSKKIFKACF